MDPVFVAAANVILKEIRTEAAGGDSAGGYASPHFNLFRKISKYVLFGG